MEKQFAIYLRVSTTKQGASGLGLESQQKMCEDYIKAQNGITGEIFKDVESGKSRTRQGLWAAIDYCKKKGATLVIAKLDRLARDVEFTFRVLNTGIDICFVDMPVVNTMILGVFAAVAQYERELISTRTKSALDAKKKRIEQNGSDMSKSGRVCTHLGASVSDLSKANEASAKARRAAAQYNEQNKRFKELVETLTQAYGKPKTRTETLVFVDALNKNGIKTATGMEFTVERFRATQQKIKRLYA